MKKIAVILSGCGVMDGSEIHEAVSTLLSIDQAGAQYFCLASSIKQTRVVNHLTNETIEDEERNILVESARIARGEIQDIKNASPSEYNAAIYVGGYGAALNLCNFGSQGGSHTVNSDVLSFAKTMAHLGKPQGFVCIAPVLIAKIYGANILMTIGNDLDTIKVIEEMGNKHQNCLATDIVIDAEHKVVTTPAYMLAKSISEVFTGIKKLVDKVITLI
jgi:enhancing lycopene biosynthesis protein 2